MLRRPLNRHNRRNSLACTFEGLEDRRLMSAVGSVALPASLSERLDGALWSVAQDAKNDRAAANPLVASHRARFDKAGNLDTYLFTNGSTKELANQLTALGIKVGDRSDAMHAVEAWVPPAMVDAVAGMARVAKLSLPDYAFTNAVTSAGDGILKADKVRQQFGGIDGTGIKIGVISDGANHRANVGATELPAVTVDPAHVGNGDEGTAMLEIVHDLAPGAQLYFSGPTTSLQMTGCIDYLMGQGCNVIVDDLSFFGESFFSDSAVAQKAQQAVSAGISYVTSAGNYSDHQHYQAMYSQSNSAFNGGLLHRFQNPSTDANHVTIPAGGHFNAFLQWSDAWGTSANDYDLYLFNSNTFDDLGSITHTGVSIQNGNDMPFEYIDYTNTTGGTVQGEIWIMKKTGAAARELELFTIGNSSMQFETDGDALIGQEAVPGVISVAAAQAGSPDFVTDYSSRGGSTIYTNFSTQSKTIRQTLDGTAIDGVQTKVGQMGFFYNPFYGTSAAAPHAAAIAALVRQVNPTLTPAQVEQTMADTATDLGAAGYDTISGAGRYNAQNAVFKAFTPSAPILQSDTGISGADHITNTLIFTGQAPANSIVRLYVDGAYSTMANVAANGAYSIVPGAALSQGQHSIQVRVAADNTVPLANNSNFSPTLTITYDTVAPQAIGKSFQYQVAPQNVSYEFSEAMFGPLGTTDLTLTNTTTNTQISSGNMVMTYDDQNDTAMFKFPGYTFGALPDGEYHATLATSPQFTDTAGNPLAGNTALDFFFMEGDANHDKLVNLSDFNVLAGNFGQSNKTFSQGDFTYDGLVNLADFNILATQFGKSLTPIMSVSNSGGNGAASAGQSSMRIFSEVFVGDGSDAAA
jgi:subtilisin family serine protease